MISRICEICHGCDYLERTYGCILGTRLRLRTWNELSAVYLEPAYSYESGTHLRLHIWGTDPYGFLELTLRLSRTRLSMTGGTVTLTVDRGILERTFPAGFLAWSETS
jgi:hypothetical protein